MMLVKLSAPNLIVLGGSVLSGLTSVAIPVHLDHVGYPKWAIAAFFVFGAMVAAFYNLALFGKVRRAGYPAWCLRAMAISVPFGLLFIWLGFGSFLLTAVGFAFMLTTTMLVPTIIGRISATSPSDPDRAVLSIRQIMIFGYVAGLGVYAVVGALQVDPMFAATAVAAMTVCPAFRSSLRNRVPILKHGDVTTGASAASTRLPLIVVCTALCLVTLMKSVDTLRGIYLPVISVHAGLGSGAISAMFAVTALCEIVVLGWLSKLNGSVGPMRTLVLVSAAAVLSFALMLFSTSLLPLLGAQAIYSIFAAGFQGVGMVLLSRVTGRDAGRGAALFMAVMQTGTVLGVTLPLLVPGYSSEIFVVALVVSFVCLILTLVASGRSELWKAFT